MGFINLKGDKLYSTIDNIVISKPDQIRFKIFTYNGYQRLLKMDKSVLVNHGRLVNTENFVIEDESFFNSLYSGLITEKSLSAQLYEYLKTNTYIKNQTYTDELENAITHEQFLDPETNEVKTRELVKEEV